MLTYSDVKSDLVINQVTQAQYDELLLSGKISDQELYVIDQENLDADGSTINHVGDPVSSDDAVNLRYLNQRIESLGDLLNFRGVISSTTVAGNTGDFALLSGTSKEYVYVKDRGWTEVGDESTYISKSSIVNVLDGSSTEKVASQKLVYDLSSNVYSKGDINTSFSALGEDIEYQVELNNVVFWNVLSSHKAENATATQRENKIWYFTIGSDDLEVTKYRIHRIDTQFNKTSVSDKTSYFKLAIWSRKDNGDGTYTYVYQGMSRNSVQQTVGGIGRWYFGFDLMIPSGQVCVVQPVFSSITDTKMKTVSFGDSSTKCNAFSGQLTVANLSEEYEFGTSSNLKTKTGQTVEFWIWMYNTDQYPVEIGTAADAYTVNQQLSSISSVLSTRINDITSDYCTGYTVQNGQYFIKAYVDRSGNWKLASNLSGDYNMTDYVVSSVNSSGFGIFRKDDTTVDDYVLSFVYSGSLVYKNSNNVLSGIYDQLGFSSSNKSFAVDYYRPDEAVTLNGLTLDEINSRTSSLVKSLSTTVSTGYQAKGNYAKYSSATTGSASQLVYLNNGTLTAGNTISSATQIQDALNRKQGSGSYATFPSGTPSIGNSTTPVYLLNGVITAGTSLNGTMAYQLTSDYYKRSETSSTAQLITAFSQKQAIGNYPVYTSKTTGSATQPVYLNNGTITAGTALGTMAYRSTSEYVLTSNIADAPGTSTVKVASQNLVTQVSSLIYSYQADLDQALRIILSGETSQSDIIAGIDSI